MVVFSANSHEQTTMAAKAGITGIDPDSWEVTLLPLPKGHSRGSIYGFCGGHPVGDAERLNSGSFGCWWPEGKPELLSVERKKYVASARASGDTIPGLWREPSSEMRAAAWFLQNGRLAARVLHTTAFDQTWASASNDGVVIGMASPRAEPGQRARHVGLVWLGDEEPVTVSAEGDVVLHATDGTRLAGNVRGRAMLWPSPNAAPVELSPKGLEMSEVQALDGDLQVGSAFKGFRAHAGFWRGSAESFTSLTPKGFQTSRAHDATHGYQVGSVRVKEATRGGSGGSDDRAVIWQGAADRWFDLNALLPSSKYNASSASAIDIRGDVVQIGGRAIRYELYHPGTPQESHAVPVAHPVIWKARLINA
jgi:hypothetical protein